jgi:hypothetical protein
LYVVFIFDCTFSHTFMEKCRRPFPLPSFSAVPPALEGAPPALDGVAAGVPAELFRRFADDGCPGLAR